MSFLNAFKHAVDGFTYCLNNERNMRIHTVFALYVLIFSRFYNFSRLEYIVLILLIGIVIACEAFNTAIEKLSDFSSKNYEPLIKITKDTSAAGVLVCAVSAAIIGVMLFFDVKVLKKIFLYFRYSPFMLLALLISLFLSGLFIKNGPKIFK